jgi:hypothetical protein
MEQSSGGIAGGAANSSDFVSHSNPQRNCIRVHYGFIPVGAFAFAVDCAYARQSDANTEIFIGSQVVQVRLHFCIMSNHSAPLPYTNTIFLIECLRTEQMRMS